MKKKERKEKLNKKSIKSVLFHTCSCVQAASGPIWVGRGAWEKGVIILNKETFAKLNINTEQPSETYKKTLLITLRVNIQWVVQSCDSSEAGPALRTWATECPAVKVEHCPRA